MPIDKKKFQEGEEFSVMVLEEVMEPDQAYQLKELVEITHRTPMRVGYKLRELESDGKAERRRIDGKIYWTLTDKAYREGTVKSRKRLRIRGRPVRGNSQQLLKELRKRDARAKRKQQ